MATIPIPAVLPAFTKHEKQFRAWLTECGAEILKPTSDWEVLRFRAGGAVSIIYRNGRDRLTLTGQSAEVWEKWQRHEPWRAASRTPPRLSGKRKTSPLIQTLLTRDGAKCFYCPEEMTEDDATIEHLVARAHGGPNHISNYVLAHEQCNRDAGLLSAMEKIHLHKRAHG